METTRRQRHCKTDEQQRGSADVSDLNRRAPPCVDPTICGAAPEGPPPIGDPATLSCYERRTEPLSYISIVLFFSVLLRALSTEKEKEEEERKRLFLYIEGRFAIAKRTLFIHTEAVWPEFLCYCFRSAAY